MSNFDDFFPQGSALYFGGGIRVEATSTGAEVTGYTFDVVATGAFAAQFKLKNADGWAETVASNDSWFLNLYDASGLNSRNAIDAVRDGAVTLSFDGTERFETTDTGAQVNGYRLLLEGVAFAPQLVLKNNAGYVWLEGGGDSAELRLTDPTNLNPRTVFTADRTGDTLDVDGQVTVTRAAAATGEVVRYDEWLAGGGEGWEGSLAVDGYTRRISDGYTIAHQTFTATNDTDAWVAVSYPLTFDAVYGLVMSGARTSHGTDPLRDVRPSSLTQFEYYTNAWGGNITVLAIGVSS